MNVLFKAPGFLLVGYVVVAVLSGAAYTKSGVWGRTFRRMEGPLCYGSVIAAYTVQSVTIVFWL
jgi:hypothetical protein